MGLKLGKKTEPQAKALFDILRESVQALLETDPRFEEFAVTVERDYRGFKYDAMTVRVLKKNEDGKKGIVSEPTYYER